MNSQSLNGKLIQLRQTPLALWPTFVAGWLQRQKNGHVPCSPPSCRRLLQVPLRDFYESYRFFCEHPVGQRELEYFLKRLRPDDTLYDIGGFRGAYAAAAKTKHPDSLSVHVFEPLPHYAEAIRHISRLNKFHDFKINSLAVGNGQPVCGTITKAEAAAILRSCDAQNMAQATEFPAISVDEYVAAGNPAPSIMKIDVDGFDLHVLQGARDCLTRHHPRLWLEVHPTFLKNQGKNPDEVLHLLRQANYKLSFFDDHNSPGAEMAYHVWGE